MALLWSAHCDLRECVISPFGIIRIDERDFQTIVLGMMCLPRRWRTRLSIPRNIILLAMWAVYAYRDIWPLATYDLAPIDGGEGNLLWAKIGLLTLAAIVLPLISPRLTDDPTARPEQNASIFSLVTYAWLDPLIWRARHMRYLPLDDLPPLAEYNSTEHLVAASYPVGASLI